jgi:hypothetical protein
MRVAVVLHERLGGWNRQLRPRLSGLDVRWFETRSPGDMEGILRGLAFPVVLIDLARQPIDGLIALETVRFHAPGARTLVLDPNARADLRRAASELGATHVRSGFAPPPFVAGLLTRWIAMAGDRVESAGWSRTTFPETALEPWAWLSDYLGDPPSMNDGRIGPSRSRRLTREG